MGNKIYLTISEIYSNNRDKIKTSIQAKILTQVNRPMERIILSGVILAIRLLVLILRIKRKGLLKISWIS
jgi:hypothetical protein